MAYFKNVNDVTAEFETLYQKACYIEEKLAIIETKTKYCDLTNNPNYFDLNEIEGGFYRLANKLNELKENYRNIEMTGDKFLRLPKDINVVNEIDAGECDDAVAVQFLNGYILELPTVVYFFKKCEKDSHFYDNLDFLLSEEYPAYWAALEIARIQRKSENKDVLLNHKIIRGIFPLHEAHQFMQHLDDCFMKSCKPIEFLPAYEIAIYEGGDSDAAANKEN